MGRTTSHELRPQERRMLALADRNYSAHRIAEILRVKPATVHSRLAILRPTLADDTLREARIRQGSQRLLDALGFGQPAPLAKPAPEENAAPQGAPTRRREPVPGAAELATPLEIFVEAARAFGCDPRSAWNSHHASGDVLKTYAATAWILRHRREVQPPLTGIANALRRDHNSICNQLTHAQGWLRSDPAFAAVVEDLMVRARPQSAQPHEAKRRLS